MSHLHSRDARLLKPRKPPSRVQPQSWTRSAARADLTVAQRHIIHDTMAQPTRFIWRGQVDDRGVKYRSGGKGTVGQQNPSPFSTVIHS